MPPNGVSRLKAALIKYTPPHTAPGSPPNPFQGWPPEAITSKSCAKLPKFQGVKRFNSLLRCSCWLKHAKACPVHLDESVSSSGRLYKISLQHLHFCIRPRQTPQLGTWETRCSSGRTSPVELALPTAEVELLDQPEQGQPSMRAAPRGFFTPNAQKTPQLALDQVSDRDCLLKSPCSVVLWLPQIS